MVPKELLERDNIQNFSVKINIEFNVLYNVINNLLSQYTEFDIPKKNGGSRHIIIPSDNLKLVQKKILKQLIELIPVSNYSMGFKKGLSIVNNASPHVNKPCILALDIENFFPSITVTMVKKLLVFNGLSKIDATFISYLCTYKQTLPQGAPTSPYLSNIICYKMDIKLAKLAKTIGADFTRYADDITFSGRGSIVEYQESIRKIISDYGFHINEDKTHVRFNYETQIVTGVVVNSKLSAPRELEASIRQQIYYCKKFGVKDHLKHFKFNGKNYRNYIFGLCSFVKMIDGNLGEKFLTELREIDWTGY